MQLDAIVIGGGLFGSIIAQELRSQGRVVTIIDSEREGAGSKPAACLMKPSWFGSLGKDVSEASLQLLDRHYGVHDIPFKVGPGHATVHWCDPADILKGHDIDDHVERVAPIHGGGARVRTVDGQELHAKLVVVAAGVWSSELVHVEGGLKGLAGMAFVWPKQHLQKPFIAPWAPYRQIVAFNRGDGVWVGDGSAIKADNWGLLNEIKSQERCAAAVGMPIAHDTKRLFGIRPYTKRKPCYLEEVAPGLWVATGGAKNGTIAAGWCAHEIGRKS